MKESKDHVGVLALQGDFQAHGRVFERLGIGWREVRRPGDLQELRGLVLPGGESTTMWHFLRQDGFPEALQDFASRGGALFGTCAGTILLAAEVRNPAGRGLGLLDITVLRNGYGRQLDSRIVTVITQETDSPDLEAVLIRAPRIVRVGAGVQVRAALQGEPVWVEHERIMATTFHPELSEDSRVHRRFLRLLDHPGHSL